MKKITLFLALISFAFGFSQTLNQNASWPNANWTVTGSFNTDPAAFEADPTVTANFAFDDDDAGGSSDDDIAAESPVIDLTPAFNNSETAIVVAVNYVYNFLADSLTLEYWDETNSVWVVWEAFTETDNATLDDFCSGVQGSFESLPLDISGFDATQLSGFRYRLNFLDDGGAGGAAWEWGFCFDSPTISSSGCTPAIFAIASGTNNCPDEEFFIDVDVTDLGSAASVNILNDGGAPAVNGVDGSASPYSVGPFPAGTTVVITVEDAADSACNDSDTLTTSGCPPECATAPITPMDGATGLSATGDINFSWTAPASGPVPDSYDFYVGFMSDGSDQGFFANTTDTFYDVAFGEYSLTVYWSIVPISNGVPAAGPCALWSATSEDPPGDACLTAPWGQWPGTVYDVAASATCDGTTVNDITTCGYNGEYSMVAVVSGENYRFESSVGTDFVTISNEEGTAAYIGGEGSVTWTSTVTGNVRFYTHTDNSCGDLDDCRTRSVVCAVTLSTEDVNANELFTYFPNPVSNNLTIKAQKNIQNVAVYNMLGQTVINSAPNTIESNVDMSALRAGAYFVKVTVEGVTETIRIIRN